MGKCKKDGINGRTNSIETLTTLCKPKYYKYNIIWLLSYKKVYWNIDKIINKMLL